MSHHSANAGAESPPSGTLHSDNILLGAFAVRPDGSLSARVPGTPPALRFAWKGRPCSAILGENGLELSAEAGMVPSTADAPAAREAALGALNILPGELPGGWELRLSPDHRVRLGAKTTLDGPATAATLVTAMVRFALALDPYLSRLGDVVGPAGFSGKPSNCPG